MKFRMKQLLLVTIFLPLFAGCSSSESFSLVTASNELELGSEPVMFNVGISDDSKLKKHLYSNAKWIISDETHCKVVKYNNELNISDSYWTFKIDKSGSYTIKAYIDDLYSSNDLTINVKKR